MCPPLASRQNGGASGSAGGRGDVPREVVDGHEGEAAGPGQRLRGREADEQRPHQARPAGHGDALHTIERRVRGGNASRTTRDTSSRWRREAASTTPP